jgi:TolA-binding protein
LAWCAFELGDAAGCADWIERGMQHQGIGDGKAGLLELLSALHHKQEAWGPAEAVARRFVAEFADHPRAAEVRYSLGVAQARAGKLDAARATLQGLQTVEMKRKDRVFYELAWVCRRQQDEKAALVAFGQAAALTEDEDLGGECRLHLGEALLADAKRIADGLRLLQDVKGKYLGRAQYLCGFTRYQQEKFDLARGHFDRIVALGADHPLYFEAQFFAGETCHRQDDHRAAAERYAIILAQAPDHARAQVARLHHGQALVLTGRHQAATAVLSEYLRRPGEASKGDQARANLWLGRGWQLGGDHKRAEQAFARVTDLTDSELSAEAQFRIGESRHARGQLSEAVEAFVKLSILYGHADWVQRGLNAAGDCYLQLKQPTKAKTLFEELVRRFPKSALAKSAKTKLDNLRSM